MAKLSEWKLKFTDGVSAKLEKITGSNNKAIASFMKLSDRVKQTENAVTSSASRMGSATSGMSGLIGGAIAGIGIAKFMTEVVDITGEMQKYEAVLTNTFGNNAMAKKAMSDITQFAAKTPFAVNELTESYVKLRNRGFDPTMKQMATIGDIASSVGKPFDQLTEAVLDATTGEYERLKDFGIISKIEGNKIRMSFKDNVQVIDKGSDAMKNYIQSIGGMQGVKGATEAIAATLVGQRSNLEDTINSLKVKIGQQLAGSISKMFTLLSSLLSKLSAGLTWIQQNAGLLKDIFSGLYTAIKVVLVVASPFLLYMGYLTAATWLLNAAWLANPLTWVVVAIVGVVTAISLLWNRSEKFRGFLYGLWASFKEVFKSIGNVASNVLGGIGNLLAGIFTGNIDKMKEGAKSLMKGVIGATPQGFDAQYGKNIANQFNSGYEDGAGQVRKRLAEQEKNRQEGSETYQRVLTNTRAKNAEDLAKKNAGATGASSLSAGKGNASGAGASIKKGVDSISDGGKSTRNITVNITKLVDGISINSTTVKEGMKDVEKTIVEALLRTLQGAEVALANE
jgi:hypothetical protein